MQSYNLEIKELNILKENYVSSQNKMKNLEGSLQLKSEELILKNRELKEMHILREKYTENQSKLEKLEDSLQLQSEELLLKNQELKETYILRKKYAENQNKLEKLEDSLKLKAEELLSKNQELEEMNILREKYTENQSKLEKLENSLQLKSEELLLKNQELKEINILREKYAANQNKLEKLEDSLKLKSEELLSKESKIEELAIVEENYVSIILKNQELEEVIRCNLELLDSKEKIIEDLKSTLREKENKLYKLEYENTEMNDVLQKEKESVKVCLDCEILKEKIKEFENLQMTFNQTQEELIKQKNKADKTMKMLTETEDNFDAMRVKKEKQIIKLNESIEALQLELRILKVQVKDIEILKAENENLKRKIDEIILQNVGDMQRLKAENLKAKVDDEMPKSQKTLSQSDSNNINAARKKAKNGPLIHEIENGQKMEADSSHSYVPIKKTPKSSKDNAAALTIDKRKRMWESGSSGSECLEIVFDSKADGIKGFVPKSKTPGDVNRMPLITQRQKLDQEKKIYLPIKKDKVYDFVDNQKLNIMNSLVITPLNNVSLKTADVNSDFLKSKENATQVTLVSTPLIKRKIPVFKGTPSTPYERKFFKTPVKERESFIKKPQSNNLWC